LSFHQLQKLPNTLRIEKPGLANCHHFEQLFGPLGEMPTSLSHHASSAMGQLTSTEDMSDFKEKEEWPNEQVATV